MPTISIKLSFLLILIFTILSVFLFSTPLHSFGPTGRAGTTLSCGSDEVLTATSRGLECVEQSGLDALTAINIICDYGISELKWDSQAGGGQGGIVSDCISFLIFDDVLTAGDLPATDCPAGQVLNLVTETGVDVAFLPTTTQTWECQEIVADTSNIPACSDENQFLQLTETGFACLQFVFGTAVESLLATLNQKIAHGIRGLTLAEYAPFGFSLALSNDGNTLFAGTVGDGGDGKSRGVVYKFTKDENNDWQWQEATAHGTGGLTFANFNFNFFGSSLALSNDGGTLFVGAEENDTGGINSGAVHRFTKDENDDWQRQEKIAHGTGGLTLADYDRFGSSLALSNDGNTLFVGADRDFTSGNNDGTGVNDSAGEAGRGAVHILTKDENDDWQWQEKIAHGTGGLTLADYDSFGSSLALSNDGNTLFVGARRDDTRGDDESGFYLDNRGAVHRFTKDENNDWQWQETIAHGTGGLTLANYDQFGSSLALSNDGNILFVGADRTNIGKSDAGVVHILTKDENNDWQWQETIAHGTGGLTLRNLDRFGSSLALSNDGNILFVGADDSGAGGRSYHGAVYVFDLNYVSLPSVSTQQVSPPPPSE